MRLPSMLPLLVLCSCTPPGNDGGGGTATKPDTLPASATLNLFPQSPFRVPIPVDAMVHPDNATLKQSLVASGTFVLMLRKFTMPVYFADAATPRFTVPLHCGPEWELGIRSMTGVPIPPFAEAARDGEGAPITGCGTEAPSDDLMTIIDLANGCEYDFWQARRDGAGAWEASWMAAHPTDGNGIFPHGLSGRASGFAYLMGAVWPDEIASGEIRHAIAVSYPYTRAGGPVAPATSSDGITQTESAIPIGARFRLSPGLDLDALGLASHEKVIARALQVYGAFIVDTGGESGIAIYGIDARSTAKNPWHGVTPLEDLVYLEGIPLDQLEVLSFGPQSDEESRLPQNRCTHFD